MKTLNRIDMLNQIFYNFQCSTQWITTDPERYSHYINKSESLIEFLEVADCGSVGGFDLKNRMKDVTGLKIFDRFLTLVRKHNDMNNIKPVCQLTITDLVKFFRQVSSLRTDILTSK